MQSRKHQEIIDELDELAAENYYARYEDDGEPEEVRLYRSRLARANRTLSFEREIGRSDLLRVNYLERGIRASRAVCYIDVRDDSGTTVANGTGFLVGPQVLLTNAHVLLDHVEAESSFAVFDYEDDAFNRPKPRATFRLKGFIGASAGGEGLRNKELDYAFVLVEAVDVRGERALADFGFIQIRQKPGKAVRPERVSIIQHPDGRSKELAIRANEVVRRHAHYIHYKADTDKGSSGAPVFSDEWELVALHHAGVKATKDGVVLKRDGTPYEAGRDAPEDIKWEANEGIRISAIAQDVREAAATLPAAQRKLLVEVLRDADVSAGPVVAPRIGIAEERRNRTWYEVADELHGYDEAFLGGDAALPLPAVVVQPHDVSEELRYRHFSIRMKLSRRQALYTACNIDHDVAATHPRDVGWKLDPRLGAEHQLENEFYRDVDGDRTNLIDRGHLVKRLDPAWGDLAREAIDDTFHWTNCALQHRQFNQGIWARLEDELAARVRGRTVLSVFTGPIFADGDPLLSVRDDDGVLRQARIPLEFWKVIVFGADDGFAVAAAFTQSQAALIQAATIDFESDADLLLLYQVPVETVEAATGLDFHWAREFQATRSELEAGRRRHRVRKGGDVILDRPGRGRRVERDRNRPPEDAPQAVAAAEQI